MKSKKIMLHNVQVELKNLFPVCQEACIYSRHCANHQSANDFREAMGRTPDLRQVVPGSWRCHRNPQEKLKGAVMSDGRFFGDMINGPGWFNGFPGFFNGPWDEGDENED